MLYFTLPLDPRSIWFNQYNNWKRNLLRLEPATFGSQAMLGHPSTKPSLYNFRIVLNIITFFSSPEHKVVQIMPLGSKLIPTRGSQFYIELYKEKFKRLLLLNLLWLFVQTQQEWSLGGPLPKLFKWFWLVTYVGDGVKK